MRGGLIPEKRTDSAGRTQTRWVKPQTAARVRQLPAAPDPMRAPDEHAAACDALIAELGRSSTLDPLYQGALHERLPALRPETISTALGLAQGATPYTVTSLAMELTCIDPDLPHDDENLPFFAVEEVYGQHWPQPLYPRIGSVIAAIRAYRQYPGLDRAESLPQRVGAAYMVAACEVWDKLNNGRDVTSDAGPWLIKETALAALFEEHHERARELAEFVIEHGPNTGAVLAHLRGDPLALSDGEL